MLVVQVAAGLEGDEELRAAIILASVKRVLVSVKRVLVSVKRVLVSVKRDLVKN